MDDLTRAEWDSLSSDEQWQQYRSITECFRVAVSLRDAMLLDMQRLIGDRDRREESLLNEICRLRRGRNENQ